MKSHTEFANNLLYYINIMNTYIFNAFIIIVLFILIKIGIVLTMLNVRNNKDDEDIGVYYEKHINCDAEWESQTYKNISITGSDNNVSAAKAAQDPITGCADFTISKYIINQKPVGDGAKCVYSPSQLNIPGDGVQVCYTPTAITSACKSLPSTTSPTVSTLHGYFTNKNILSECM